jgi:hypothetical protein
MHERYSIVIPAKAETQDVAGAMRECYAIVIPANAETQDVAGAMRECYAIVIPAKAGIQRLVSSVREEGSTTLGPRLRGDDGVLHAPAAVSAPALV